MIKQSNKEPRIMPVEISIIAILVCAFIGFCVVLPYVAISSKNEIKNSRKELVKAGITRVNLSTYMDHVCKPYKGVNKLETKAIRKTDVVICVSGKTFPVSLAIKSNDKPFTPHEKKLLHQARWDFDYHHMENTT